MQTQEETSWVLVAKKGVKTPIEVNVKAIEPKEEEIQTYDHNMRMDDLRDFDDEFDFQNSEMMLNIRKELDIMIDELSTYERLPFMNYFYHEKKNYFYTFSSYMKKHSIEGIQLRNFICQHNEQISGNIQEDEYDAKWNEEHFIK